MAELTIRPEEIRSALDEFVESYKPSEVAAEEATTVDLAARRQQAALGMVPADQGLEPGQCAAVGRDHRLVIE